MSPRTRAKTFHEAEHTVDNKQNLHPNIVEIKTAGMSALMTVLRDCRTDTTKFQLYADRMLTLLAEEGLASLPTVTKTTVQTPCSEYMGIQVPPYCEICVVSIVRSGDTLLEAVRRIAPGISCGHILIQRDEEDELKPAKLFYSKLPPRIASMQVLLVDPMLATGGSASKAIAVMLDAGVPMGSITFLNVVACPEGLSKLAKDFPEVKVVTGCVDPYLNDDKYIVPGLGDFGDRYYGTGH